MWSKPEGCGGYKIVKSEKNYISLAPVKSGLPVTFYLNNKNHVNFNKLHIYDIVSVNGLDLFKELDDYISVELFDPLQIFVGLNAKEQKWKNRIERCNFLSKLSVSGLKNLYQESATLTDDLLPQGTLGYRGSKDYFTRNISSNEKSHVPEIDTFCLAYLTVSIQDKFLPEYEKMIKAVYPNVLIKPIRDAKQFGKSFQQSKCDAFIFGLKSNYLDGYEYVDIFANNDANFSGIYSDRLSSKIKMSQTVSDTHERAKVYRDIINEVNNLCVIRSLITLPMRTVYIRKSLSVPDIGLGPLNEYYLGNVTKKINEK